MAEILKPCPFCGGKARINYDYSSEQDKTFWQVWHDCPESDGDRRYTYGHSGGVDISTPWMESKVRAIAAWNRRAERTCHVETTERRVSQTQTLVTKSCSACGYAFGDEEVRPILPGLDETMALDPVHVPSYCPHCGARVVEVSE